MDCEVLFPKVSRRGAVMLQAMIDAAPQVGVRCIVTQQHERKARLLMAYGLGHLERRLSTEAHVAGGGRLIGWDLGYWDRDESMRVTVDDGHPQRFLADMPAKRWEQARIRLRDDFDPGGRIVLVGMGPKSRAQFGFDGPEWELAALQRIRDAYPGWKVIYRPKKPEMLPGVGSIQGPIEDALRGASLVVCRHSNVAVDACIAGIPVVCEDGAAAALYWSDICHPVNPGEAERRRFLQNLAWWQWKPSEAVQAWQFLLTVCG